jgi:hypothetical protein
MRRASPNRSMGKAAKSGRRAKVRLALQPDALGVATRLAAGRLRDAGIVLKPLLRSAGLSVSQIDRKDMRISACYLVNDFGPKTRPQPPRHTSPFYRVLSNRVTKMVAAYAILDLQLTGGPKARIVSCSTR